jgi:hypothetical protein
MTEYWSSPAMIPSCSGSGSARSGVPGSQRSSSIAPKASSASSNRTVGSPFQKQPGDLVRAFHVRHAELQDRAGAVLERHRRYPSTTPLIAVNKWMRNLKTPAPLQFVY